MKFGNKGFTLVELMLVVGIIGIIVAIAIPTISGHRNKAQQSEAKISLAAVYAGQQVFHAETGTFYMNLVALGYAPEGVLNYRLGFGSDDSAIVEPRDYSIGFKKKELGHDSLEICGLDLSPDKFPGVSNNCKHTFQSSTGLEPDISWKADDSIFLMGAKAHLAGNKVDIWSMDQSKKMIHVQNGAL